MIIFNHTDKFTSVSGIDRQIRKTKLCANFRCPCVVRNDYYKRKTLKVFTLISLRTGIKEESHFYVTFGPIPFAGSTGFSVRHVQKSLCLCVRVSTLASIKTWCFYFCFHILRCYAIRKKSSHFPMNFKKSAWQTPSFSNKILEFKIRCGENDKRVGIVDTYNTCVCIKKQPSPTE